MEFPLHELMDEQACDDKLVQVLHPEGLGCPRPRRRRCRPTPPGRGGSVVNTDEWGAYRRRLPEADRLHRTVTITPAVRNGRGTMTATAFGRCTATRWKASGPGCVTVCGDSGASASGAWSSTSPCLNGARASSGVRYRFFKSCWAEPRTPSWGHEPRFLAFHNQCPFECKRIVIGCHCVHLWKRVAAWHGRDPVDLLRRDRASPARAAGAAVMHAVRRAVCA